VKITKAKIKKISLCPDWYRWYLAYGSSDLLQTLLDANKVSSFWAPWVYTRLMTLKQRRQFAIYAAKEVLHLFEEAHPDDRRHRLAIKATRRALKSNTKANRKAALDAAHAANYTATACYKGFTSHAASTAIVYAGYAVGCPANARTCAASAADFATLASGKEAQEKLIRKAVKFMEKK